MTALPSILDADVSRKTVLVRADLNVPVEKGRIGDMARIDRFAPTVKALTERGAKVVVLAHLGSPCGFDAALSLGPVAHALEEKLGRPVRFVETCVGDIAEAAVRRLSPGGVLMLENLRFHAGEDQNSRGFALRLSLLGDIYVNDACACAERRSASITGIREFLPAFAGPSLLTRNQHKELAQWPA